MDRKFKIIGITPEVLPENSDEEREMIISILSRGEADIIHVRHPEASEDRMRKFLREFPDVFLNRITLHDNFRLVSEFNVGGIHLNSRNPVITDDILALIESHNLRLSRSCHSFEEISDICTCRNSKLYKYVTLSPIFDSISKIGYKSAFSLSQLKMNIPLYPIDIIALGGIRESHWALLKSIGFKGAAMLGNFFCKS